MSRERFTAAMVAYTNLPVGVMPPADSDAGVLSLLAHKGTFDIDATVARNVCIAWGKVIDSNIPSMHTAVASVVPLSLGLKQTDLMIQLVIRWLLRYDGGRSTTGPLATHSRVFLAEVNKSVVLCGAAKKLTVMPLGPISSRFYENEFAKTEVVTFVYLITVACRRISADMFRKVKRTLEIGKPDIERAAQARQTEGPRARAMRCADYAIGVAERRAAGDFSAPVAPPTGYCRMWNTTVKHVQEWKYPGVNWQLRRFTEFNEPYLRTRCPKLFAAVVAALRVSEHYHTPGAPAPLFLPAELWRVILDRVVEAATTLQSPPCL
jgi:hypothetical protein